jgi:hypothetical protein
MLTSYLNKINYNSLLSIVMEYSGQEIGIRHPEGPVGVMCRDQGILDLYSGKSRILLDLRGQINVITDTLTTFVNEISINTPELSDIILAGYRVDSRIADREFLVQKQDVSQFLALTQSSFVQNNDGSNGIILNTISFGELMETQKLFKELERKFTTSAQDEFENEIGSIVYGY